MKKWFNWTVLVLLSAGYYFGYKEGILDYLLAVDASYLAVTILALTWLIVATLSIFHFMDYFSTKWMRVINFVNNRLTTLGLLSTVTGLILATYNGIPDHDMMVVALGTALIPTGLAIVANFICDALIGDHDGVA